MKMPLRNFALMICFIFLAYNSQAQVTLALDSISLNPNFLYTQGDQISFTASLRNTSATSFAGSVSFGCQVDSTLITDGIVGDTTILISNIQNQNVQLSPAGTLGNKLSIGFDLFLDPQYFKEGNDILVVWPVVNPAGGGPVISSSVSIQIVKAVTGLENNREEEKWLLFADANQVSWLFDHTKYDLKRVSIYAISGALMTEQQIEGSSRTIDVSALSSGLYVIRFSDAMHQLHSAKFWKP